MLKLQLKRSCPTGEFVLRMAHLCIGLVTSGFCAWAMTQAQPGYRWIPLLLMAFGLISMAVGLFGQRKTVLHMLFLG